MKLTEPQRRVLAHIAKEERLDLGGWRYIFPQQPAITRRLINKGLLSGEYGNEHITDAGKAALKEAPKC